MEITNKTAVELINQAFQTLLVIYLLLFLVNQIWTGVISNYFNINYLLVIVIITGILSVFTKEEIKKPRFLLRFMNKSTITTKDYIYISLLSIAGIIIIFIKTGELGWLRYVISIIAGILIFLLSYLVLDEEDN